MRKKKHNSICIVYEGYRERHMLDYLAENSKVHLNIIFSSGGTADSIIVTAIKHSARGCPVYVFFDEDFERKLNSQIAYETFETLADLWRLKAVDLRNQPYRQLQTQNENMRNPIFVVSNPISIDGLILQIYGETRYSLENKTTTQLKNALDSLIDKCTLTEEDMDNICRIDEKITRYKYEIQHASSSEKKYIQNEIAKQSREKSRVKFMRFLYQTMPIDKIACMRIDIPEIALLLDAFEIRG